MSESRIRRGLRPGDFRFVVRRPLKLPRTLGAPALFSACYGNVGSSIYYALGVTAAVALGLTPLAFLLAGGIFVTTALNYAEGTAAMPHAGGSASFARRAFNDSVGFIVGWIQLLNYTATVSISAYTAIAYLGIFGRYVSVFASLTDPRWHVLAAVALTGVLIVINIVGIQESSALNLGLALLDLVTQVVLVVLGAWMLLNIPVVIHNIRWGIAPTWGSFLASVSIAMVSYTGIETISNMSEEARDPGRAVPRATFAVIAAVLIVSAFLPTVAMSVFPVTPDGHGGFTTALATQWRDDPVAGIVSFFPGQLAYWAGVWVAILAFTILVIGTNAGLIGISRLSFSMAHRRLFPAAFGHLHPKFKTPWVSILAFGGAAALLIVPARIDLMAAVYSLAATFAFATAHLAVMRLRYVAPTLHRPYTMPFNVRFGRSKVPVLSVVGAIAIGSVFAELVAQNISNSTWVYMAWVGLGVVAYVAIRRVHKQPLWDPLAAPPRPPGTRLPALPSLRPEEKRVHVPRRGAAGQVPIAAGATVVSRSGSPPALARMRRPRRPLVTALALSLTLLIGVGAVAFDLSSYDPFGPGLGWSVGVVAVLAVCAYLLLRSRLEE